MLAGVLRGLAPLPKGPDAIDSEVAIGLTHGGGAAMPEHLETDSRTRPVSPSQILIEACPAAGGVGSGEAELAKRLNNLASKLRGVPADHSRRARRSFQWSRSVGICHLARCHISLHHSSAATLGERARLGRMTMKTVCADNVLAGAL